MSRDRAELNSLFGRDAVEAALSRRFLLNQWEKASVSNLTTVIKVMQDLEEIIDDVPRAIAYCQKLDDRVRGCVILALSE
ncbi:MULTISPECIES: hypothetical protein [unclassified Picosynechococcus]|uniref:hypothetical protein n=1 Tax=unclassified Picosynechococcus TaxID=3079910 RepID=UPI000745869F|nr:MULTISPECIES: hypothetical protein [unclassified Picosynechococcus]AMA10637.1 hypothetical protein AWQ23_14410 [Picosynechococcus sp. PCC 73109]AMA10648.1 hypothetical protein AWQ23_14465 [Picosynechococcus sp. PCC 73109]ANV88860.1 hypothetical protein AWQ22_14730 [Picosynechococcus sp. PCC 7117]